MASDSARSQTLERLFALDGKVALVTGASSGIGAHAARLFAEMGCHVVVTARREQQIQQIAKEIQSAGGSAEGIAMDVSHSGSVEQVVEDIISRHGALDVLLNNAGIARTERFLEMSEQDWQAVMEINLNGVWRVAQRVARKMVQGEGGSIINVASVLGMAVQRQQTNYAASKAAVLQLTRNMALELGRSNIRVNAIAPGYIVTGINREFFASERGSKYLQRLFPQRAGELEELDGTLLLLAGAAGSYINGSVITVDGGSMLASL